MTPPFDELWFAVDKLASEVAVTTTTVVPVIGINEPWLLVLVEVKSEVELVVCVTGAERDALPDGCESSWDDDTGPELDEGLFVSMDELGAELVG